MLDNAASCGVRGDDRRYVQAPRLPALWWLLAVLARELTRMPRPVLTPSRRPNLAHGAWRR
eukprot:scaffold2263_cov391-Prasinococcus_capsulatus_cf.AAC.6